jgi:hypothetical protein
MQAQNKNLNLTDTIVDSAQERILGILTDFGDLNNFLNFNGFLRFEI